MNRATLQQAEAQIERMGDVMVDVALERVEQDKQWGGPAHDDTHTCQQFAGYMSKQVGRLVQPGTPATDRQTLVKIAALAVSAIQSLDRRHPEARAESCECPGCQIKRAVQSAAPEGVRVLGLGELLELLSQTRTRNGG